MSFTSPAERLGRGSLPLQKQLSDFARLGVGRIFDGRVFETAIRQESGDLDSPEN